MMPQTPQRIQRQRTKGWKMPKGAIYVGRPSRWGNPFKGEVGAATMTRQYLVDDYLKWLTTPTRIDPRDGVQRFFNGCPHFLGVPYDGRPTIEQIRTALEGKDLACWCPIGQPCHADVLLRIANGAA